MIPASEVVSLGVVTAVANPCCPGPKHSRKTPGKDRVLPRLWRVGF